MVVEPVASLTHSFFDCCMGTSVCLDWLVSGEKKKDNDPVCVCVFVGGIMFPTFLCVACV